MLMEEIYIVTEQAAITLDCKSAGGLRLNDIPTDVGSVFQLSISSTRIVPTPSGAFLAGSVTLKLNKFARTLILQVS